ncbi:MAG: response regulator transcription factor [Myxococcota bacterium]
MSSRPRLLLVEDEAPIRDGLVQLFETQDFVVEPVGDGISALQRMESGSYDVVILDRMLPGLDGLSVLQRRRAAGDETPILLLTAKGAEDDIVAGLEAGADDYVTKPFGIRELLARARGLLRRPRPEPAPAQVDVGPSVLDFDRLELRVGERTVRLTAREGTLLDYLHRRLPKAVAREELLVEVWGYRDGTVRTRTVDVHIQQLRAKLKTVGADGLIETVRGVGYRFGLSG